MSGESIAAWLRTSPPGGHELIGVFYAMARPRSKRLARPRRRGGGCRSSGSRTDHKQGCCTASDAADARRVADRLDIPFYAIDFQEDFAASSTTSSTSTRPPGRRTPA